jgi:hypothetical protein
MEMTGNISINRSDNVVHRERRNAISRAVTIEVYVVWIAHVYLGISWR